MKKIFLLTFLFHGLSSYAQVGIGTKTPNTASLLELKSTTQGFLPPRMTPAERTTLSASLNTTTTGMVVLDSATGRLYIWSGTAFVDYSLYNGVSPITVNTTTNTIGMNEINNMQPYLAVSYCIATSGVFPERNGTDAYIGEIDCFVFNFAPVGWALCDGSILSIASNTALFSLLGTNYGGNGTSTFALPDLRGRVAIDQGQGAGLTNRSLGDEGGTETTP